MALRVGLDRDQVRAILSLYHLEGPDDFGGLSAEEPAYWVQVGGRKYLLRVSENRCIDDMIFEKEVLVHLERHALPVPRLVRNVAHGTFTPWSARGRYVSLFELLPGRPLGVFEIRPRHARTVGQLSARMHRAFASFSRRRRAKDDLPALDELMSRLARAYQNRRLARRFGPDLEVLERALDAQHAVVREPAAAGTVHGNVGVERVRFDGPQLTGVVGFEHAATRRWTWDLAMSVHAWCWSPSVEQQGGPAGGYDPERVRAMLRAYHRMRPLDGDEQAVLAEDLRLTAVGMALRRIAEHELRRPSRRRGPYQDYRHYVSRLRALDEGAAERMVRRGVR